jgi:hypothetical protein
MEIKRCRFCIYLEKISFLLNYICQIVLHFKYGWLFMKIMYLFFYYENHVSVQFSDMYSSQKSSPCLLLL